MTKQDDSIYDESDFEKFTTMYMNVDSKTKEQLYAELCAGFSTIFKNIIKDLLNFKNRRDFDTNVELCCYGLYLAKDFESKDVLEKYDLIFKSISYGIAWTNDWIVEKS